MTILTLLLSGLQAMFGADTAHAQVSGIIQAMGGGGGVGAGIGIINTIHNAGRSLVVVISTLMLVRAAAKMIASTSEDKMEEGRRSVGMTIIGIILVSLTYTFVTAFWNGGDHSIQSGATELNKQIVGLVRWAQVLVGILAVGMIVISGFKVIASFGKDDGGEELKRAILGAVVGVFLVAFDTLIISTLGFEGNATPTALISLIMSVVAKMLVYLALLAVAVIIYAGIMMIITVGNEEQFQKSKSLIGRVLIGLVIILFSYFVVDFIVKVVQ